MLFRSFAELFFEMSQRALAKQVNDFTSGFVYPFKREITIDKTKHFNFPLEIIVTGPLCNLFYSLKFARRNPGGGYLDAIYLKVFKKQLCNMELLDRRE